MSNPCNIPGCDAERWVHDDAGTTVFEPYCKPHAQDPQSHLRDTLKETRPDTKQIGGLGYCHLEPMPPDDREPEPPKYDGPPPRQPWEVWHSMSKLERDLWKPMLKKGAADTLDQEMTRAYEREKEGRR